MCSEAAEKVDVLYLMDASTSVGVENWQDQVEFVTDSYNRMDVGNDQVHVGLITFRYLGLTADKTLLCLPLLEKKKD